MDEAFAIASGLLDWSQHLRTQFDDLPNVIYFRAINDFLHSEIDEFGVNLLTRTMQLAGGVALILLTLWIIVQGYRIVTGRSHESMMALMVSSLRASFIVGLATGMAVGGSSLFDFLGTGLSEAITQTISHDTEDPITKIDRSLAYMGLALSSIDSLQTEGDVILNGAKDRAMAFVGFGIGGPALAAGTMLLLNKIALALFIGLGPLFVLCLLFDQTKGLFTQWLYYGIGTMFSLAVLSVMVDIALKMLLAVAVSFWVSGVIVGANTEGITSLAMQQGGLGLILTMLIISAPPMAAMFFRGMLGNFMPFSAFGQGHGGQPPPSAASYYPDTGKQTVDTPPYAFRDMSASVQQTDEIKRLPPSAQSDSDFLVRYPNALASLDGGPSDSLPKERQGITQSAGDTRTATDADLRLMQQDIDQRRAQGKDTTTAQQALDELWTRQHAKLDSTADVAPNPAAAQLTQGIGWGIYSQETVAAAMHTANMTMAQSPIIKTESASNSRVYLEASDQVGAGLEVTGLTAGGVNAVGRMGQIGYGVRLAPSSGVGAPYFVASGGKTIVPAATHAEFYLGKGIRPDMLNTVGGTLDWNRAAPLAGRLATGVAWAGALLEVVEVAENEKRTAGDIGHVGATTGMTVIGFAVLPVGLTWAAIDTAAQSYHYTPVYATEYGNVEINGWRAMRATAIDNRERGIQLLMNERRDLSQESAEELFDARDFARRMELGQK